MALDTGNDVRVDSREARTIHILHRRRTSDGFDKNQKSGQDLITDVSFVSTTMTPGKGEQHGRGGEEQCLYRCTNCGKPYVAWITANGNVVVRPRTGCGHCDGEEFVPYETADTETNPA